ncbi:MAG: tRNA (adenosine(37)-N6)-threonylcarbamoyltransferase complex transferase subunit TsaD [Pseudomonadota bacterium]|nr:tRNA (adenosine(37)-N6)-threonylcarbamoyltransferase complex transferase subunit TsaD [Pseudomonadota bacterium]
MIVLGIESSCDETAAALVGPDGVRSDVVYGQAIHAAYGGVVPEIASRAHAEQIVPVVRAALDRAGVVRPDAVAATAGPGLIGAVLVGLSFGRAAALGWGVPFMPVNHLEGHLLSPLLDDPAPAFPFLALVVSGGHTTLYLARGVGEYETLAETVDDAVGEAFDKVARMLGLGYPGGPLVDALAQAGDPAAVPLPRPRVGELDMSFAGLKTAVRTRLERFPDTGHADLAASFQEAVCDVLVDRIQRASLRTGVERIAIGGGVAANSRVRARVAASGLEAFLPPRARCTDNGAMIANVGRLRLLAGLPPGPSSARPRWAVGTP